MLRPGAPSIAFCLVALGAFFMAASPILAGGDAPYMLRASEADGDTGETVDLSIVLELNGEEIFAWSVAVCHDADIATLIGVAEGAIIDTANGGDTADFHQILEYDEGFVAGAIICVTGCESLPPGEEYELYEATYSLDALAPSETTIEFCDDGLPAVSNEVVLEDNVSVTPEFEHGLLRIVGPEVLRFVFHAREQQVLYDPADGVATFEERLYVTAEEPATTAPQGVEAFTMALRHDPMFLEATGATPGADLLAVDGGRGPELFQVSLGEEGVAIDCVVAGAGEDIALPATKTAETVVVSYATNPLALRFNLVGTHVDLSWDDALDSFDPNAVVVDGFFTSVSLESAVIQLAPGQRFVRGDANSNDEVGLSDAIAILMFLFVNGAPAECDDAADVNDDGTLGLLDALRLLRYLFVEGQPPAQPFPECGFDTTGTPDCQVYNGCP